MRTVYMLKYENIILLIIEMFTVTFVLYRQFGICFTKGSIYDILECLPIPFLSRYVRKKAMPTLSLA